MSFVKEEDFVILYIHNVCRPLSLQKERYFSNNLTPTNAYCLSKLVAIPALYVDF